MRLDLSVVDVADTSACLAVAEGIGKEYAAGSVCDAVAERSAVPPRVSACSAVADE